MEESCDFLMVEDVAQLILVECFLFSAHWCAHACARHVLLRMLNTHVFFSESGLSEFIKCFCLRLVTPCKWYTESKHGNKISMREQTVCFETNGNYD